MFGVSKTFSDDLILPSIKCEVNRNSRNGVLPSHNTALDDVNLSTISFKSIKARTHHKKDTVDVFQKLRKSRYFEKPETISVGRLKNLALVESNEPVSNKKNTVVMSSDNSMRLVDSVADMVEIMIETPSEHASISTQLFRDLVKLRRMGLFRSLIDKISVDRFRLLITTISSVLSDNEGLTLKEFVEQSSGEEVDSPKLMLKQAAAILELSSIECILVSFLEKQTEDAANQEIITSILHPLKIHMENTILWSLRPMESGNNVEFKEDWLKIRKELAEVMHIWRISASEFLGLISVITLSEESLITIIYLCLSVFNVEDSKQVAHIQTSCMEILCYIYSRQPTLRHVIVDEIFTSLSKFTKGFMKIEKNISMFSILIFSLLQSGVAEICIEEESDVNQLKAIVNQQFNELQTSISQLLHHLLKRAYPVNNSDKEGTYEDYRHFLDCLLKDSLALRPNPGFPIADLVCTIFTLKALKFEDQKAELRKVAVEWYGEIVQIISSVGIIDSENQQNFDTNVTQNICCILALNSMFETRPEETWTAEWSQFVKKRNEGKISSVLEWSSLPKMGDYLFTKLLNFTNSDVITVRTKAMKSLQDIILVKPSILDSKLVYDCIMSRMRDPSPKVRSTALDLISNYVSQATKSGVELYTRLIGERINDDGISVRKKSIKLLNALYVRGIQVASDRRILIHAIDNILSRLNDEEDSVSELAQKCVLSMWFSEDLCLDFIQQEDIASLALSGSTSHFRSLTPMKQALYQKNAEMLSEYVGSSKNSSSLFLEFLMKILPLSTKKSAQKSQQFIPFKILVIYTECLMEKVVNNDMSGMAVLAHFSKAYPRLLVPYITNFIVYLDLPQPATQVEMKDYEFLKINVLQIITHALPFSDIDNDAALDMQNILLKIIDRSSLHLVTYAVPCLCVLCGYSSKYESILKLFNRCSEFLNKVINALQQKQSIQTAIMSACRCMLIASLIIKTFECETLKTIFGTRDVSDQVFKILMFIANTEFNLLCSVSVSALAHVYIRHPRYLLRPESQNLMKKIFEDPSSTSLKVELIRSFVDFIKIDEEVKEKEEDTPGVDINKLVGNSEEMGNRGIGTSIIQLYINYVIDCMLVPDQALLTSLSFQLIELILEQGTEHPLTCLPSIVAMETHPDPNFRRRACAIHNKLYAKHSSFMNSKNREAVKLTYRYQKSLSGTKSTRGYRLHLTENGERYESLLENMFSLTHNKKAHRNNLIASLVKMLEHDESSKDIDLGFCLFVAECIGTLTYSTREEVLQVIYLINQILSIHCGPIASKIEQNAESSIDVDLERITCVYLIMLKLKKYLKARYSISDMKIQNYIPSLSKASIEKAATSKYIGPPNLCLDEIINGNFSVQLVASVREEFLKLVNDDQPDVEDYNSDDGNSRMNSREVTPRKKARSKKTRSEESEDE